MVKVNQTLEQLTRDAVQAVQEGRWDRVIELYHRRSQDNLLGQTSPQTAKELLAWDQWVTERVKNVMAAIHQQIVDLQEERRKLETLKRQWTIYPSRDPTRHLQTI